MPCSLVIRCPIGGWEASALARKPSRLENRPGAGSTLAANYVAKSAPDGYTIWLQDMTAHAINATMYRKLPYDSVKDFAPITLVAFSPLMLGSTSTSQRSRLFGRLSRR